MTRYISERHAQEAMSTLICDCIRDKKIPSYEDIADALLTCPTADVVEVRHGKWLVIEDELWKGGGRYECSACGYGFSFDGYFELDEQPYCPHCGARMEVEDEQIH